MTTQMDIIDLEGILEEAENANVDVLLKTSSLKDLLKLIDKDDLPFD